ncbi:alanyl-tRNS synthetase [Peptoniphilus sp. MSJ-1]|uniref:Alanyl-tRNS synthetase n=1 Tax=Peptoniphilus ovalis TaxID=2841503 RepID=A0ABS6FL04_9FIRM|nr:alanyl-tRNS synthetase [Peptoniphilus ovalis]MBU5669931.1 alanyl-tRNS synthetase [Peptoniphilus ovalis]
MNAKINPYKSKYKIKILKTIEENNNTYGKLEYIPFFTGTERVAGDLFKINNESPEFLERDLNYVKIDDSNLQHVDVEIDFKNRLSIMQQNLANALVRHFIKESTDITIKDYKVLKNSSYIDIYSKDLKFTTLDNLESMSNYALLSNIQVENNNGNIVIDKLAKISYFGPSLNRTGEVGMILIHSVDRIENLLRINIIAGESAYKFSRKSLNLLNNIKMYLGSEKIEDVFSDIKKIKSGIEIKKDEKDEELEDIDLEHFEEEILDKSKDVKENKSDEEDKVLKEPKDSNENENIVDKKMKEEKEDKVEEKPSTYQQELLEAVDYFKQYATEVSGINYIYKALKDINLKELKEVSSHILKNDNYIQIYGVKNSKNPHKSKVLVLRSQNLDFNLKDIFEKIKEKYHFTGTGNIYTVELECEEKDTTKIMENFLLQIKKILDKDK